VLAGVKIVPACARCGDEFGQSLLHVAALFVDAADVGEQVSREIDPCGVGAAVRLENIDHCGGLAGGDALGDPTGTRSHSTTCSWHTSRLRCRLTTIWPLPLGCATSLTHVGSMVPLLSDRELLVATATGAKAVDIDTGFARPVTSNDVFRVPDLTAVRTVATSRPTGDGP
jgi:hypothetical protein